jgi:hypothetical protein
VAETTTVLHFENKFFTAVEGSYFRKSAQSQEPVMIVWLGDEEAALPIAGIRRELKIAEDSPDHEMLGLVSSGLDYVKVLQVGDELPKELLTGEASWQVTDENKATAKRRVYGDLIAWMSGGEGAGTDAAPDSGPELEFTPADQQAEAALEKAAAALDCTREAVEAQVGELIYELSHIESLRERFGAVLGMEGKITRVRRAAKRQSELANNAASVSRLMSIAIAEFNEAFAMVDGQTGEIIGALKNFEVQKDYIRKARDTLYRRMMAWDDTLRAWVHQSDSTSTATAELMAETYRFLAPRYMPTDDWLLTTQAKKQPALEEIGERW